MTAHVIPFPRPQAHPQSPAGTYGYAEPRVLREVRNPLVYWHAGGDVFRREAGRSIPMSPAEARRRLYQHEQDAVWARCTDRRAEAVATAEQLNAALKAHERHARITGRRGQPDFTPPSAA